jgi:hypothetical protein
MKWRTLMEAERKRDGGCGWRLSEREDWRLSEREMEAERKRDGG